MNEQLKIDEANHFRQRMGQVEKDRDAFAFEVSAFLTAARSVLQYALYEVDPDPKGRRKKGLPTPPGRSWFESRMAASAVLRFFKEVRDLNIHVEPVAVTSDVELTHHDGLGVSDAVSFVLTGPDGQVKQRGGSPPAHRAPCTPPPPSTLVYRYRFTDWPSPDEIPTLCDRLLSELRDVVADGRQRGMLT